jgi:uncharacterized protein
VSRYLSCLPNFVKTSSLQLRTIEGNPMVQPVLDRIEIFPIKSLDGMVLDTATLLPSGALKGDRRYVMVDSHGKWINGKANARVHRLRSTYSPDLSTVTISVQDERAETFDLVGDRSKLEAWLSAYFEMPVHLEENTEMGFPDDTDSPGPTVISTATLTTIARWFPGMDISEARRRFRTNLELSDAPAFWEDQLYGKEMELIPFKVGEVNFLGVNPCQRCIVPTRESQSGTATSEFQKTFVQQRQSSLPDTVERSRFNHFYRLAVNTRLAESATHPRDTVIHRGDSVQT